MGKNFAMNSNSLFDLIHSLSRNEKGYIKKMAFGSKNGENKAYIKLFDAISDQEEYNEAEILDLFKNDSIITHFSKNKNYLFNLILKKLTQYHEENINEFRIKSISNQALILFKKGLFKEAATQYGKALKYALEDEELLTALDIYNKIISIYLSGDMGTSFPYRAEMRELIQKINKENEFNVLYCELIEYMFTDNLGNKNDLAGNVQAIIENPIIASTNKDDSFKSQWYALSIQGLGHYLLQDFEKANLFREKQSELIAANSKMALKEPARLVSHLANSINNKMNVQQLDALPHLLEELKNIEIDLQIDKRIDLTRFSIYHTQTITYFTKIGDFKSALLHLDEMIPWLEENKNSLSEYITLVAYDKIFFTYFGNKEYRKALQWLNRINNSKSSFRKEFQFSSKFNLLMVHFELKNYEVIDSVMRNIYREMLKNSLDMKAEKLLLRWFLKHISNSIQNDKLNQTAFADMREKIHETGNSGNWGLIKNLHLFEVWMNSKVSNRDVAEIYRQDYQTSVKEKATV